ncbi:fatty acid synthase-like [Anticarsia gemmatalis]|uniref:fatty acid synthase-like n=1 Tax=Anticarsia gemmatalis TaxID=129554 RepID=UPI003F77760D
MDFSGTTEIGDRVMGIVRSGAASTQLQAQSELLWPVPAHWSLEDAATVPLAYLQAFYCLVIKGQLHSGMTVLIQEGVEPIGQAAISIALACQCRVFTTVNNNSMKRYLQEIYLQLKARDMGPIEGVHIILNNATDTVAASRIIHNFDSASRHMCPELKYFTILTTDSYVGKCPYISPSKENFEGGRAK